jgi:hypothetical protein
MTWRAANESNVASAVLETAHRPAGCPNLAERTVAATDTRKGTSRFPGGPDSQSVYAPNWRMQSESNGHPLSRLTPLSRRASTPMRASSVWRKAMKLRHIAVRRPAVFEAAAARLSALPSNVADGARIELAHSEP